MTHPVALREADDGRGAGEVTLLTCIQCRTTFLSRYDDAFHANLYSYYDKYIGRPKNEVYNQLTRGRYIDVLKWISTYSLSSGRAVLDVGCGKGDFLDAAISSGWDAEGIELSSPAVAIAQQFGLPARLLSFFSNVIPPQSRDVITMFEVIEHVPAPAQFLARAETVLRPGGLCYLTTPNYASLDRRLLGSKWEAVHREHITYFTPHTFSNLVKKSCRLELLYLSTRNLSSALLDKLLLRRQRQAAHAHPSKENNRESIASSHESTLVPRDVREVIESSAILRASKSLINGALSLSGLGATLIALLRRPV